LESVVTADACSTTGRGIRLTRDQAFVLSDWLYQVMFQSDDLEEIVRDRAVWSPICTIQERWTRH
jgi:hypothetical protein